jgi:hypothetical protein
MGVAVTAGRRYLAGCTGISLRGRCRRKLRPTRSLFIRKPSSEVTRAAGACLRYEMLTVIGAACRIEAGAIMTVLRIRSCKRYAVRRSIRVLGPGDAQNQGLLIEIGQEGGRISGLGDAQFISGDIVVLELQKWSLPAGVRWSSPGLIGIRFEVPLFIDQLNDLIMQTRGEIDIVLCGT